MLTDGRATAGPDPRRAAEGVRQLGFASVVVDTEEGHVKLGMAAGIADALGARLLRLDDLRAEGLVREIERRRVA
jgi:magnesium chelatase subunit D